jgi:hypothetical protein
VKDGFAASKNNSGDTHYISSLSQDVVEKIRREEMGRSVIKRVFVTQTVTAMQVADVCKFNA